MSKMEILSPQKQITITSGDKMAIIDPDTGRRMVQDLKKMREQAGGPDLGASPVDQSQALDMFNFTLKEQKGDRSIIEGKLKKPNSMIGKVEFEIDTKRNLPVAISIYNPKGGLVSTSALEYENIKDAWVITRNRSEVRSPQGSMKVNMEFSNIKLNEGIPDKEFRID